MRKNIFLVSILASILTACSNSANNQDAPSPAPPPSHIQLYPMKQNGKWGFINAQCKMIIPPQFSDVDEFSDGLARADNTFIDETGKPVINLMPLMQQQIMAGRKFNDGVVVIRGIVGQPSTGLVGLMNTQGQIMMLPYSSVDDFSGGMAAILSRDGAGYINPSGQIVIPPKLDNLGHECGDGLCAVSIGGSYGYIDYAGKTVISPQFKWAHAFSEGLALVAVIVRTKQLWGYIDHDGRYAIASQYDEADAFSEGLAAVKKDGNWGFIDKQGLTVVDPLYADQPGRFHGGLARILLNGKMAYIDTHGHYVCTTND